LQRCEEGRLGLAAAHRSFNNENTGSVRRIRNRLLKRICLKGVLWLSSKGGREFGLTKLAARPANLVESVMCLKVCCVRAKPMLW